MASIVDRGTRAAPKFFAKYDFVDASGERKQRWKLLAGVQTKKQATQELARVEREVAAGRDPCYFNTARPRQGIGQRIPDGPVNDNHAGKVIAIPVLGGLHHDYRRAA